MDGKLCPGIQPPPPLKFSPPPLPLLGKASTLIKKFFKPPFLNFGLNLNPPPHPLERGEEVPTMLPNLFWWN